MDFCEIKKITLEISVIRRLCDDVYLIKKQHENKAELENEISILKQCAGCSRINQMVSFTSDYVLLSLAKCSLYDETKNTVVPCSKTRLYISQIVDGIHFLHSKNIIHRDIKQENILIGHDGALRLCDFGLSVLYLKPRKTVCGTAKFLAPEIVQEKDYGFGVDVWALGIVAYELLYNQHPFFNSFSDTIKKLQSLSLKTGFTIVLDRAFDKKGKKLYFPHTRTIDNEMLFLIENMLVDNKKRMTINEIRDHAYIKSS